MESFWSLASGGSTVEEFARDVYIKSNLATRISAVLKQLNKTERSPHQILTESSTHLVNDLTYAIEAAFLHGLKEKLSLSKVLVANKRRELKKHEVDFWPVVLILSHNQVADCLMNLNNIASDIGRCRAWIRLALNDNLLSSYVEALVNDTSLLHGFYRPSAYLRDKDHMKLLKSVFTGLDTLSFQLNYNDASLTQWNIETLKLVGVPLTESPVPVMPALDALDLLNKSNKRNKRKSERNGSAKSSSEIVNNEAKDSKESGKSPLASDHSQREHSVARDTISAERGGSQATLVPDESSVTDFQVKEEKDLTSDYGSIVTVESQTVLVSEPDSASISGNSIIKKDGWSSSPPNIEIVKSEPSDPIETTNRDTRKEETYDEILHSYSSAAILSSTPDIRDFNGLVSENTPNPSRMARKQIYYRRHRTADEENESNNVNDFEIISKSIILKTGDPETQDFLRQLPYISNEVGLDEQDYKCSSCGRPVGMIYGNSKICSFDGYNYCLECHNDEKAVIPARVIHNWDFQKYAVCIRNNQKLQLTETEPFFDIKVLSPVLYKVVPEMNDCLVLRTQLFYLHAYLFTCQESVALDLRKTVWPREHLYEHIHLYSLTDLIQVNNGTLRICLKKAIQTARKHVLSCLLCSQKGFICEICKSSQIIYPFDTESTYRCDKCKAVYHSSCIVYGREEKPCPRCLRIEKRERAQSNV